MQPLSGNQRPDILTALMNMSLVLRLPRKIHLCRSSSNVPRHRILKCYKTLTFCSLLTRCTIFCACHAKRHLNVQKCSVPLSSFTLLTGKCASCHDGVHFWAGSWARKFRRIDDHQASGMNECEHRFQKVPMTMVDYIGVMLKNLAEGPLLR